MKVSVVVCTYTLDMYEHFREAADSVLAQTHDDVELVVVVDGTPAVYDRVIEDYGDRENTVIACNEDNVGLVASRNRGAELASGDVIAFINDDAVADETRAERLTRAYEEEDAIAASGKMTPDWVAGKPLFFPEEFYWLVGVTHRGLADGPDEVRNTFNPNISSRMNAVAELEGFDTDIEGQEGDKNLQGGGTELCARMRERYRQGAWYDPEAEVAHKMFEYRTEFWWLVDRAFWQGYSKRAIEDLLPETEDERRVFLYRLATKSAPRKCKSNNMNVSVDRVKKLLLFWLSTVAVRFGYLYATARHWGVK